MSADFEIIVGTYEQFLLGYKIQNIKNAYSLKRSFATHSHLASIRSVASNRHYLASAGADDTICLYDMRHRIESGRLTHHSDTVNCIDFTPQGSHIVTGSNDGNVGIVRCGNWVLEKYWKLSHKGGAVNALAIHPTGKLAMTTGGDGVLRTWNLVKGRQAYATNLVSRLKFDAKHVTILRWSPEGDKYLLVANTRIDVYSVETAGLCRELSFDSRVVCVVFMSNSVLAVGHEDGKIRFCDLDAEDSGTRSSTYEAHDARVKCLARRDEYLVSASSSGEIKLWNYRKNKLSILTKTSCDARITCITLAECCRDLRSKTEEPKNEEIIEKPKTSIFRMRREVIVEDEAEESSERDVETKKVSENKSSKKRTIEAESEEIEIGAKKKKTKKKKKEKNVASSESNGVESTEKKKKRSFSTDKLRNVPNKKTKTEIVTKVSKDALRRVDDFNNEDTNNRIISLPNDDKKKKKKKKKKKIILEDKWTITTVEKSDKAVLKKRKSPSSISNVGTNFSTKTKKKKMT